MRRYTHALRRIVTNLVGETRKAAQEGVYLIERAVDAVLAVLRTAAR
jgi:hypothetical protein